MATLVSLRNAIRRQLRDESAEKWTDPLLNDAINNAIEESYPAWYELQIDSTTVTTAASTYSYTLPSDCEYLAQVWIEEGENVPYGKLVNWRVGHDVSSTGTVVRTLFLDNAGNYGAGNAIRLVYLAKPHALASDSDSTTVPSSYVQLMALVYLAQMMITEGPGHDVDHWRTMMAWAMQRADDIRKNQAMQLPISHVHYSTGGVVDVLNQPGIVGRVRAD